MDRIQTPTSSNSKLHKLSHGHVQDNNINDLLLGSVKFNEIPNTTSIQASSSNFDLNALGRRRSQSQGVLRAANANFYDATAPDLDQILGFNLGDTRWEEEGEGDEDEIFSQPITTRKPANSFHVPVDFELATNNGFSQSPQLNGSPLRPFNSVSSSVSRDRAESDFGRYSSMGTSMKSPLAVETETKPQRMQSNLAGPLSSLGLSAGSQASVASASSSKNDWTCAQCGNQNYAWRHVCNMRKCRAPKPGHLVDQVPPGSWACLSCGNLNYAERMVCNMRKCRAPRPLDSSLLTNLQQQQQQQQQQQAPFNYNMYFNMLQQQQQQNHAQENFYPQPNSPQHLGVYGGSPKVSFMMNSQVSGSPLLPPHGSTSFNNNSAATGQSQMFGATAGNLNLFNQNYSIDDLQSHFDNEFHLRVKENFQN